jgi:hypothetical protein
MKYYNHYNHPRHYRYWQQYVNELMGRGEYGLKSPTLALKFQAEMARAAIEADRAAEVYSVGGLYDKSVRWRNWAMLLRGWIKQLNTL